MPAPSVEQAQEAREFAESIIDTVREGLLVLDGDLRVVSANASFYRMFGASEEGTVGLPVYRLGDGRWDVPGLRDLLENIIPRDTRFEDFEVEGSFPQVGYRVIRLNARRLDRRDKRKRFVLLAVEDVTERVRTRRALEEAEAKYQKFAENLNSIIVGFDRDGKITFFNHFAEKLFGRTREEMVGRDFVGDLLPRVESTGKDNGGLVADVVRHPEKHYSNESEGLKRSGERVWFSWNAKEVRDRTGAVVEVLIDGNDLTPQRERIAAARQAYRMLDIAPDSVSRFDLQGRYLYVNRAMERLTGRSYAEMVGKPLGAFGAPGETVARYKEAFARAAATKQPERYEVRYGDRVLQTLAVPELDDEGNATAYVTYSRDITSVKSAEERYRLLYETMTQGVVHQDGEGRIISANDAALRMLGKTWEEFIGSSSVEEEKDTLREDETPFPGNEHPSMVALATGKPVRGVVMGVYNYREQRYAWIRIDAVPLFRKGEERPYEVYTLFDDITERRRTEEALRRNHELLEAVTDSIPDAVNFIRGDDLRVVFANRAYRAISGSKEVVGKTLSEVWAETGFDFDALCRKVLKSGEPFHAEDQPFRIRRSADGPPEVAFFTWWLHPLQLPGESGPGILNVAFETTQRKMAEDALREREELFRSMADNISQLAWMADEKGWIFWYNKRWYDYTGTTLEEMRGWGWKTVHHPDCVDRVVEKISRSFETGAYWEDTFPLRGKDGQYRWFLSRAVPIRDESGRVVRWFGTNTDITVIREAEEARRISEEQLNAFFTDSPSLMLLLDDELRISRASRKQDEYLGMEHEAYLGRRFDEVEPKMMPYVGESFNKVLETGVPDVNIPVSGTVPGRPGERLHWISSHFPVAFPGGRRGLGVVGTEVTGLVRAEEALRRREGELRSITVNSPDVIARFDRELRHTFINPYGEKVYGRRRDEIIGRTNADLGMPPEKVAFWKRHFEEVVSTGRSRNVEFEFDSPQLGRQHFLSVFVPEFDEKGEVSSILAISRDVTRLKEVQRHLSNAVHEARRRAAEAEEGRSILEAVMTNIPEGIVVTDREGTIRMLSSYMSRITGTPPEEAVGRDIEVIDRRLAEPRAAAARSHPYPVIRAIRRGEETRSEERTVHAADGTDITVLINARPIRSGDGTVIGALSSWLDITKRKKSEDILRRNEYELRTLVDNSPDLIFRMSRQMRYVYVNPAYERLTGIPRERFAGRTNGDLGMSREMTVFWKEALGRVFGSGREHSVEFQMTSFFGSRYFLARLIPEFSKAGVVETALVLARDITEHRKAEERIRYISFHDEVTGLFNRAFFEEEVRRVDVGRDMPVSIVMGDVNNLKLSNDVFGHEEGDRLLKAVADVLRAACRSDDIIARWGGDEFAVILPKTGAADAKEVCRRIGEVAAGVEGTVIRPSIAVGVATKESREQNIYQVIREAEERMYRTKLEESRENEEKVFTSLRAIVDHRAGDRGDHIARSSVLAGDFGAALGLGEDQLDDLHLLIRLHDIGDVAVPREILMKPGRLTPGEWEKMKTHAEAGFRIVKTFADTARISDEVYSHGERWDGGGYPRGLKGKEIPYLARIFSVLDAFDVMTHPRPYAGTLSGAEAVEELRRNAGTQFDPELAKTFIERVAERAGRPELSR